jgi:HK97 family phage prohead protease
MTTTARRPLTTRALLDPAFEQRKERRNSMRGRSERRTLEFGRCNVELRGKPDGTGGTNYSFTGYAAVYEAPFEMWDMWGEEYIEVCGAGACTRTLANNPDVPFLIGHDSGGISLARTKSGTLQLSQDDHGLYTQVPDLDGRSPLVQSLASAIDRGDMDEMSLAFVCRQQQWSPDYTERRVLEMDIHRGDVSIVCLAANPATAGATMIALGSGRPGEARMPTAPYTVHPGEDAECNQCKSANDLDASFCDQCGAKMSPAGGAQVEEDETQQCQACLCMNATDAKYCDQCGLELAGVIPWKAAGGGYVDSGYWKSRKPAERRAADEIADLSSAPDYNPDAHGDGSIQCQNECAVDGGAMNAQDARFCDQCGGPLYASDGTLILDDSGVVEEAVGDANLLGSGLPVESLRRQLDLLRWRS